MSTQQPGTQQPNQPKEEPTKTEPSTPGVQPASPVNPDPKAHPIHPEIPVQPIHEGTDPKQPIKAKNFIPGDGA